MNFPMGVWIVYGACAAVLAMIGAYLAGLSNGEAKGYKKGVETFRAIYLKGYADSMADAKDEQEESTESEARDEQ